jgi:ribosomal protein L30/L7E
MYVSASQFGMVKIVSYYISIGNMLKNVSWIRSKLKVVNKTRKSLPIMVSLSAANFHYNP